MYNKLFLSLAYTHVYTQVNATTAQWVIDRLGLVDKSEKIGWLLLYICIIYNNNILNSIIHIHSAYMIYTV